MLNIAYAEAGPVRWTAGHSAAWLALRHSQLCRCDAHAGLGRLSRDRALSARLRCDALPFERRRFRNGQPSALAVDVIAFMDALKIEKAILAGFDWGARTANIVAALWPERVKALVAVSGYLIGSQEAGRMPLPPKAELEWWYQFYFATERGRLGYEKIPERFQQADLAARLPKMEVRRRDVRTERSRVRQSRSCRHRGP